MFSLVQSTFKSCNANGFPDIVKYLTTNGSSFIGFLTSHLMRDYPGADRGHGPVTIYPGVSIFDFTLINQLSANHNCDVTIVRNVIISLGNLNDCEKHTL